MATGTIQMPYEGFTEYTLTKEEGATNWTLTRSHFCVFGKTAYLQLVCTVTANQDRGSVIFIKLPVSPLYAVEGRSSSQAPADCNWNIRTNGELLINRTPVVGSNFRINASFPIA